MARISGSSVPPSGKSQENRQENRQENSQEISQEKHEQIKWRLLRETPLCHIIQEDAFSSGAPQNREQVRNNAPNCKARNGPSQNETAAPTDIGNGGNSNEAGELHGKEYSTRRHPSTRWVKLGDTAALRSLRERIGGAA
ncbi:hypothetical protein ACO2JO_00605 [Leptospira interrogans]